MKNFVVYKSSAGSGKTFTLVKEYLRLALQDEKRIGLNYKRILALTFTNKAAAEMKNRVIDALNKISKEQTLTPTGFILCEDLKIDPEELKLRAKILLSEILHHYSDFSIGTIDSFTHKVIKTFAHDLDLPVNFNIELDTRGFYEKVIDSLFSKIGEDEYISKLLIDFALTKARDNTAWDPQTQIHEFSELLLKENSELYLEQLKKFSSDELESFRKEFMNFTQHYKSVLREESAQALKLIKDHKLTDDDFIGKSRGPQNFFRKCYDAKVELTDTANKALLEVLSTGNWTHKTSSNSSALEKISPQLNQIAEKLLHFVEENNRYYSLCIILSKQMYPLMLLKKIEEISEEQKAEERLVFISEFNQKISEIIHNEPSPFIYERLGERYRHFLLDEFQDTSSLQWHNLLPLLDNSLANGWSNLIVGDGKQSIYRWRNADVKQFAALPQIDNKQNSEVLEEIQNSLLRNYHADILKVNYRSLKTIVEFNNTLFSGLSEKLLSGSLQKIYEGQIQEVKNNEEGFINIFVGKKEKDELEEHNFSVVLTQISKAIADGYDYKDICIICRVKRAGSLIANYLIEQKIPVVSSDSLLLENNLEVCTIINYLSYLSNRQDTISAAAVINYLFQSQQIKAADYHTYLSELSAGKSLFSIFKKCNIDLSEEELSLNNLFDNCIEITKALHLNKGAYQYIRFFLDEINEYLVLKNSSIASFFDWWQTRKGSASMIIPDNTNAVKVMTIHTSKGLEFPVVIVPFCSWPVYTAEDTWVKLESEKTQLPVSIISLNNKANDIGFGDALETEQQDQLLDNLNLLYVTFTRAVERLHIIASYSATIKYISVAHWLEEHLQNNFVPVQENYYEFGSLKRKTATHNKKSLPGFKLDALTFTTSKNAIQIKNSYLLNNDATEAAKQEGILTHWLLSKMPTASDIDSALNTALMDGLLEEKQFPALRSKLEALVASPELKTYFSVDAVCKLEAELITSEGEILRPDRIVFDQNETVLLDYKTGKENNTKYFKQLLKYEAALRSMGYKNIKKLLIYVDELKVIQVN